MAGFNGAPDPSPDLQTRVGGARSDAAAATTAATETNAGSNVASKSFAVTEYETPHTLTPRRELPRGHAMIGDAGGAVISEDEKLTLVVPQGSVTSDKMFSIKVIEVRAPGSIGTAYELEPHGTVFEKPVVLTFAQVPGIAVSAVKIGTLIDGVWQPLSKAVFDAKEGKLSALTPHFSVFGQYVEACDETTTCSEPREACVPGLAPTPVCAIPCRDQNDCPDPLYCIDGGCALQGCYPDEGQCTAPGHVCTQLGPEYQAPADRNYVCLPACNTLEDNASCPSNDYMMCSGTSCMAFQGCSSDADCGGGQTCFGSGILAPEAGECVACDLGCDCRDPDCGCLSSQQKRCGKCDSSADCAAGEECSGDECVACAADAVEICGNGIDDDCDRKADEGCVCSVSADCDSMEQCSDGVCVACSSDCTPGNECDSLESCEWLSACDGDHCLCVDQGNGCGAWQACAAAESCGNGQDDDCNGSIDDGC
jgi:hypothetical protein